MKILYLAISAVRDVREHSISLDLMREFQENGHEVYIVAGLEKRDNTDTYFAEEDGFKILRVRIGNNKKAGLITKGITTVMLPRWYIRAIKQHLSNVKFDLVLYQTPPITHYDTVKFIKKRDRARSYLLLKDIFPQNAVDIGMMSKSGVKGVLYRYFRKKEKKFYAISDNIGCMSQANVDYVLRHDPWIDPAKVEVCPNAIAPRDMTVSEEERRALREKYGIPLDKKVFVYGGNLGKPQGIPFLMECLRSQKQNEDAYFLIVGDGTEYGKLEQFFTEGPADNQKLLKRLPKEDYDRLVAACDVGMIFLDHRFTIPNFPSRLLAYLQAGIPVLAATDPNTDIGKTVTEGGLGWWCESNDVAAFDALVKAACASDIPASVMQDYLAAHYDVKNQWQKIICK